MNTWEEEEDICVCIVHANTLIAFMKEIYTNILNIYSFFKAYSTLKNMCVCVVEYLCRQGKNVKNEVKKFSNTNSLNSFELSMFSFNHI
jgi:hypothetical protein